MLHKNAKIYIAGHRGLVGSAIWKNLQEKGYTNLVGRTHKELDLLDGVAVRRFFDEEQPEYVFIHDGARMFVDEQILTRGYENVEKFGACVAGMPSKDTVKLVDEDQFAVNTPPRKLIWAVQTPQIFKADLIENAYAKLMEEVPDNITDDAMVVEQMMKVPVKLYEGSYENIKITTPEDLEIAKVFLAKRKEKYHK